MVLLLTFSRPRVRVARLSPEFVLRSLGLYVDLYFNHHSLDYLILRRALTSSVVSPPTLRFYKTGARA